LSAIEWWPHEKTFPAQAAFSTQKYDRPQIHEFSKGYCPFSSQLKIMSYSE